VSLGPEPTPSLSIGAVVGGVTASPAAWKALVVDVSRFIQPRALLIEASPRINVVYHVPGEVLTPEHVGVRTGHYSRARDLLMVQAAIVEDVSAASREVLYQLLVDAIDAAEAYSVRKARPVRLEGVRAIVASVEALWLPAQ